MLDNKTFYPTPKPLRKKMLSKLTGRPVRVLDPSAGKGGLLEAVQKHSGPYHWQGELFAIEIDPELQATLRGKHIKLLDSDFLQFSGPDQFDLIIANPPFNEGDKHLLKALDIMRHGEIIFLLNAETLKNPYTNLRKDLARESHHEN